MSINNVLLGHSHTHLPRNYLWLPSHSRAELGSQRQTAAEPQRLAVHPSPENRLPCSATTVQARVWASATQVLNTPGLLHQMATHWVTRKQGNVCSHSSGGPKSEIQGSAGPCSLPRLSGSLLSCFFQLLLAVSIHFGHQRCSLWLHLSCLCHPSSPCLVKMPVVG